MFKRKKNKKVIALLGVWGLVFLQLLPAYTQAATITSSLVSGTSVDTSAITTATSAVTSKQGGPTVDLSFTTDSALKNGAAVTATATTSGYTDSAGKLYFTWYLKHDGCDLTNSWWDNDAKEEDGTKLKNCDLDGDNLITPNDWKITAARIIVRGTFERSDADYSSAAEFVGATEGGVVATPSVTDSDTGWVKNFKRDNGGNLAEENDVGAPNCYVQQPASGIIYELRKTKSIFDPCPSGYHPSCIKNAMATCDVLNPDFDLNSDPSICQDPDPDPSCVYPKSVENDFTACVVKNEDTTNENAGDVFKCNVKDIENYTTSLSCKDDSEIPICTRHDADTDVRNVGATLLGRIFEKGKVGEDNDTNGVCSTLAKANEGSDPLDPPPSFLDNTQPKITSSAESCSVLSDSLINGVSTDTTVLGVTVEDGTTVIEGNADLGPACTFEKKENLCKHLFPYFPEKTVTVNDKKIDLSDEVTGDGKFTLKEKEFWGSNPSVASTNGKQADEANIMGLGVDGITWAYSEGDEVGVTVEGTSDLATDHNDSSYRTMWAFSQGVCSALSEIESRTSIDAGTRAFYTEEDKTIGILTADFDLDRCLEENLAIPNDNGASSMKIDLTATPDNPINDPNGSSGDSVTVVASTQNVTDLNSVYYTWKIEKSSNGAAVPNENTEWKDITSDMINNYASLSNTDRQGLAKSSLVFLLNLPADIADPDGNGAFYLRARVTASENSGAGNQTSQGSIIIKVLEQENQVIAYSVIAGNGGDLSLNNGVGTEPICNTQAEQSTCYVTKNKIIGLKIPNNNNDLSGFSWKVNNASMTCDSGVSTTACSGSDNSVLFMPILGNVGESVDAVVSVISKKTSGTVEITRHFVIVEPQVIINSADVTSAWTKLMGYYKDLDGIRTPDYSSQVFETNPGKTVKFTATVYSSWGQSSSFDWSIDGTSQDNSSNQISFYVDKASGESYNISLTSTATITTEQETQNNNLRKALLKNWGVSPENSVDDEDINTSIQLDVTDSSSQALLNSDKTGIFASLITNLPEQIMFLIKIILTVFTLMLSTSLLFAFVPESIFERR